MKGVANVMRHFIPLMKQGTLVNITSGWGRIGAADVSFDIFFFFKHVFTTQKMVNRRTQLKEFVDYVCISLWGSLMNLRYKYYEFIVFAAAFKPIV